jgi:biopolymer transport protein TolR
MSMSSASASNGGRRRRSENPMSEINVTPLVDVMLVLLVIFIVTAPAMKAGMEIDLPKAATGAGKPSSASGITVTINQFGAIQVGDQVIQPGAEAQLRNVFKGRETETVTLKAHKGLTHGAVVHVMSVIRASGVSKIVVAVDAQVQ